VSYPTTTATTDVSGLLARRHILVTGAASGIGAAVAASCERAGATVVRADLTAGGGIAACDVRSEADVEALFSGPADGVTDVVHCAGIASTAPIEECSLELWQAMIDTNQTGSFLVGREFARRCGGPGSLTFLASAGGLKGAATYAAYGASKFGVVGLMRCMALELAPRRLRVNAVCPTGVRTPMVTRTVAEESRRTGVAEDVIRRHEDEAVPIGRMAEPEEVADVCVFLASELARHVAGATLLVDGAQLA
jgi:NAD(P)-dependent dehydrogenase (short-subunit alcohol dehydrogenase family)